MDYFLADDLSGALDAAGAFHHAGRRVVVALTVDAWPRAEPDEIVAVTTETRNRAADRAAEVVRHAIAQGTARGARLVYKKIDSTLRGQVAAELRALEEALPEMRILFSPANPRVGRTVRDGVLLVHGVAVSETEFARDPLSPVRQSSIPALLGESVAGRVEIADAQSDEDLAAAVARMESRGSPWVAIGSGALARPVALLGAAASRAGVAPLAMPPAGPVLFVCGSTHPNSRAQAERLTQEGGVPMHEVTVANPRPAIAAALRSVSLQGAATLVLQKERVDAAMALRALVSVASDVLGGTGAARVFATGGDTAFALCRAIGVTHLRFVNELEAGMSLSLSSHDGRTLLWAIKPGGFSDSGAWLRAWHALRAA